MIKMSGMEEDAFKAKRYFNWSAGARRKVKVLYNRKLRKAQKREKTDE